MGESRRRPSTSCAPPPPTLSLSACVAPKWKEATVNQSGALDDPVQAGPGVSPSGRRPRSQRSESPGERSAPARVELEPIHGSGIPGQAGRRVAGGRIVGIVSHTTEVKSRVDDRIELIVGPHRTSTL